MLSSLGVCVCVCACVRVRVPPDGDTALILAAWYGHVDITKLLLEANATVDATNCDGNCALNCAAYHGFMEVRAICAALAGPSYAAVMTCWGPA